MVIISAHQESSIDYPGKFGQILFTSGCNFNCGFCHNPDFVRNGSESIDIDTLLTNLKSKAEGGWYEGICISGGEPTLYTDLPEFIMKIGLLGLKVKLDTNGSNPDMLELLLDEGSVDYIAMDIKCPKDKYEEVVCVKVNLNDIEKSIGLVNKFNGSEYRTTVLPFLTVNDFENMGKWVTGLVGDKVDLWTVQQFSPEKTLDPKYGDMAPKLKHEIEEIAKVMEKYAKKINIFMN